MATKRRIAVNLSRTVNLGEFESVKGGVFIEQDIAEKDDLESVFDALWASAESQVDRYLAQYEGEEGETGETMEEVSELTEEVLEKEELAVEEVPVEEEGEDLTEEDINVMTLPELKTLCKETEGLEDVDLTLNLKPLRAVLIDMLFEDDEETGEVEGEEVATPGGEETGAEGEWQDGDWQDD